MIYCPIISKIHYIEILNTVPTWYCKYEDTEFSFDLKNNSRYLGFKSKSNFDTKPQAVVYFIWIITLN